MKHFYLVLSVFCLGMNNRISSMGFPYYYYPTDSYPQYITPTYTYQCPATYYYPTYPVYTPYVSTYSDLTYDWDCPDCSQNLAKAGLFTIIVGLILLGISSLSGNY